MDCCVRYGRHAEHRFQVVMQDRMYGLEDAQLERIFPGAKQRNFGLV